MDDIEICPPTMPEGLLSGLDRAGPFEPQTEPYPTIPKITSSRSGVSLPPHSRYRDGMTIRAVSPDSDSEMDLEKERDFDGPLAITTTPPRTPSKPGPRSVCRWDLLGKTTPPDPSVPSSPERAKGIINKAPVTAASQLADLTINRTKSRSPTEKTHSSGRTTDDNKSDVGSPVSSYVSRHRHGNAQGTPESGPLPMSVGYPSTQSAPSPRPTTSSKSGRHRLLRLQPSVTTLQAQVTKSPTGDQPASPTNAAFDSLLQLMKIIRGRMEGYVDFRIGDSKTWTKGYCLINVATGSLLYQRDEHGLSGPPSVLVPDLRGCQVYAAADDSEGVIDFSAHSLFKLDIKIRPLSVQQYDHWLAALLCWSPIRPAGAQNKMVKPQPLVLMKEKRRRNSDSTIQNRGDAPIIKVGRIQLWRPGGPTSTSPTYQKTNKAKLGATWQTTSCTLQENGEFRLHRESDSNILAVVQLSQLSRCAVQQLDPSILDQDFCIAIYPQYTPNHTTPSQARPLYLGIDTRILFEVWFVLLRAFTMPEIYGPVSNGGGLEPICDGTIPSPKNCSCEDSYRIQRGLFLRVVEAKITMNSNNEKESGLDCYAEVILDGEARAKTMVRTKTHNPFWREDYEFTDLPTVLVDAGVVLKQRDPRWKTKAVGSVTGSGGYGGGLGGMSLPGANDAVIGRVDVRLDDLNTSTAMEGWLPLTNTRKDGNEERVGEVYLKIEMEELIVLMGSEYKELLELLQRFENKLTVQLGRVITDLKRLADTLLQIFQVSNKASDWLMALASDEIDGLHKDITPVHEKPGSSDGESGCRNKNGLADANILFRGNSLLTKALDSHMKRLGREYLDETLGHHLQKLAVEDTYCEVDPLKIDHPENLQKNWKTLLMITKTIWQAIFSSASRCPLELRKILRYIRQRVEEKYGELLRTVSYISVCGFLFLRFFCPAILNPKLFGLLKDHPGVRAQRTLTLLAKSLQGLANMTTFGIKEPFMSPMNEFLADHSSELKDFIDLVTNIPPSLDKAVRVVPPSYATPITIFNRLSQASKEGFPSLPYLIDQPRAFAALVTMWLKFYPMDSPESAPKLEDEMAEFNAICRTIQEKTRCCIEKAENAERPDSSLSSRWEEVAEKVIGVPARDGVYTQSTAGSKRMHRVVASSSIHVTNGSEVWTPQVGRSEELPPFGYTVAVSTGGHNKSRLGGILGGFGGARRKTKIDISRGD